MKRLIVPSLLFLFMVACPGGQPLVDAGRDSGGAVDSGGDDGTPDTLQADRLDAPADGPLDTATTSDTTSDTDGFPDGCQPDCTNRECGDDGCGDLCGICTGGSICSPSFTCEGIPRRGSPV